MPKGAKQKTMEKVVTNIEPAFGTPEADAQTLPAVKVYTSDKLVALKAAYSAKFEEGKLLTDYKQQQASMMETFKISKDIDAELSALKTADLAEQNQLLRSKKLAIVTVLLASQAALLTLPKNATEEARNNATDAFTAAKEAAEDAILAKGGGVPRAAKVAHEGDKPAGSKGSTGAAIVELHIANLAAGMTAAESKAAIVAGGHSRGTTGAVVLAWEKEQGLK